MMPLSDYQQPVELYLNCKSLKDKDFIGKSDPKVKVYLQSQGNWAKIGETETIKENLNPDFKTTIKADFVFETQQPMRFEVIDVDKGTDNELIGTVETTLGEVMGARKQTVTLQLLSKHKKPAGKLTVRGDKIGSARNQIFWQWSGVKLMNTDGAFGKSDPFLRFFKEKAGDWLQVHETEFVKNNLDPIWQTFKIGDDRLCTSDHSKTIRVECWDNEPDGNHRYIGVVDITLNQLKEGQKTFHLMNQKKDKSSGTLKLLSFSMKDTPSFVDFIRGGEQLNAVVAIDFTGSNGDPKTPRSLHARFTDGRLNEYQQAITNVCEIIMNYDYDQMVPVFGFGGKPHFEAFNQRVASHCFPCTGNVQQSQVLGLKGILDVYHHALDHVQLSGPTYFAPILSEAIKACEINKQNEVDVYTIMLILTDGAIHDMDETIDIIVGAADLPISVIIIGVGGDDFKKMEILDGDKGLVNSKEQRSARDFVQFVPFRKFKNDPIMMTKNVLAEVPNQLVEYKALIGQKARQPLY